MIPTIKWDCHSGEKPLGLAVHSKQGRFDFEQHSGLLVAEQPRGYWPLSLYTVRWARTISSVSSGIFPEAT